MKFPAETTTDFLYVVEERLESSPESVSHAWALPTLSEALETFVEQGCINPDRLYQIYFLVETHVPSR